MSTNHFKMAGANDKFNKEHANLILLDLVRYSAKEVSIMWNCSTSLIYTIKKGDYPYNYVLGTEAYNAANVKRIHNQVIVMEKFATGIHKTIIAEELKMGLGTIYKIFNIWKGMTAEEKEPYFKKALAEHEEEPEVIEETQSQILSQKEIEEVQETDSNGDKFWVTEDVSMDMSFDESLIETQCIEYKLNGFEIWRVTKLLHFPTGTFIFVKEEEVQELPEKLALELIKGIPGTPTITFKEIRN